MRIITLEPFETALAAQVGLNRHLEAIVARRPDLHAAAAGDPTKGWQLHIEGACGEMAVAKAVNRYWNGSVNTFKTAGDIGGNIQVRTRSRHDWDLIVRSDDRDEDYFFLVTGRVPRFHVAGWIRGMDAKRDEWLQDHGGHGPAYFVPQHALKPIPGADVERQAA